VRIGTYCFDLSALCGYEPITVASCEIS